MAEEQGSQFQEKTEPATPKKKEDSRKKGKVAKSIDLNSAVILLFGLFILYFSGSAIVEQIATTSKSLFASSGSINLTANNFHKIFVESLSGVLLSLAPLSLGLMIIGLATSFAQVGFVFSGEALKPNWQKLNPINGIRKVVFSRRAIVELLKGLIKITILGIIAFYALGDVMSEAMILADADIETIIGFIGRAMLGISMTIGIAYIIIALADFIYQKFDYERELRMTKQEIKDENKQNEGDPLIKSRIRTIQRQIAYKRMMHDVPKADVVVTNPTHLAIALKYDVEKMAAPKVVAKGAELVAQKIREIANENNVPVIEDKPLARLLFKSVDVGEQIPDKLFQAVAQLLAFVYRMKNNN